MEKKETIETSRYIREYREWPHHVIENAELLIVGISPGTQKGDTNGDKEDEKTKKARAFIDTKRTLFKNLIKMLDEIEIYKLFDLKSSEQFWEVGFDKVDFTSILENPITEKHRNGKNTLINKLDRLFIQNDELLVNEYKTYFLADLKKYKNLKYVVLLGPEVDRFYDYWKSELPNKNVVKISISHPSGANSYRVNAFLTKHHDASIEKAIQMRIDADNKIKKSLENKR